MVSIKNKIKYKPSVITIVISLMIIINIVSHYFRYIADDIRIITSMDEICWIILLIFFIYSIFIDFYKIKIYKISFCVFLILIISTIIGWNYGIRHFKDLESYFAQLVILLLSYFLCICVDWSSKLTINNLDVVMKVFTLCATVSVVYADVFQYDLIVRVLTNDRAAKASWNFYSFFSQRNIYACVCFLAIISSIYLFERFKKKRYIVVILCFIFNLYITDSQTSIFSAMFFLILYIYFKSEHKIFLIASIILAIIVFLLSSTNFSFSKIFSNHMTSFGVDSGRLRINMWIEAIKQLSVNKAWLCGMGDGSNCVYLINEYGYGSFHNGFIDVLFKGGLIRLMSYIFVIYISWKKINSNNNIEYKNVMKSALLAFCLYSCFEAGGMFFELNYFAVTTTMLFIMIPLNIKNEDIEIFLQ